FASLRLCVKHIFLTQRPKVIPRQDRLSETIKQEALGFALPGASRIIAGYWLQLFENPLKAGGLLQPSMEIRNRHPFLFGGVPVPDSYRLVFERLVVHRNTEWCADQVLTGIPLPD